MIKKVKTNDLQVGMYVILPRKWFSHPFISNHFMINSKTQIIKMIETGIDEVSIDLKQSKLKNKSLSFIRNKQRKSRQKSA